MLNGAPLQNCADEFSNQVLKKFFKRVQVKHYNQLLQKLLLGFYAEITWRWWDIKIYPRQIMRTGACWSLQKGHKKRDGLTEFKPLTKLFVRKPTARREACENCDSFVGKWDIHYLVATLHETKADRDDMSEMNVRARHGRKPHGDEARACSMCRHGAVTTSPRRARGGGMYVKSLRTKI